MDEDLYSPFNQTHWEFNTPGDAEGWSNPDADKITYFDVNVVDVNEGGVGALLLDLPDGTFDPWLPGPAGPYYSSRIDGLAARMRFNVSERDMAKPSDGGQNTFYWFYVDGGHGNSPQFEIPVANEWFTAYVDCSDRWGGWINNFRMDFAHVQDYTMVDVDWIRTAGHYIKNNGFEGTLDSWNAQDDKFSLSSDAEIVPLGSALQIGGNGVDNWHNINQQIDVWDRIPSGAQVTLRGMYYVPTASWEAGSALWFRIREFNGTPPENLTASEENPRLDAWTPFEYTLTTIYDPAERTDLSIQLYSKTAAGTSIYVDDVFVEVVLPDEPEVQVGTWPLNAVRVADGQVISVDGQVSADEYAGAQALTLNADTLGAADPYAEGVTHQGITTDTSLETSAEDYTGTFYFMWDDQNLYVALSAQDDLISPALDAPNGADCLQFVLAPLGATATSEMFIPTIAPDDGAGQPKAKNDFGGWLAQDLFAADSGTEVASSIDAATGDWTVEVKIPWTAMQGVLAAPAVGDQIGYSLLGIDYDNSVLEWFGCVEGFPWTGTGLQTMTFVDQQ